MNYRYGLPKSEIDEPLKRGKDVILEVDVRGAKIIREKKIPGVVFIFIKPSSFAHLVGRIKRRGTESREEQEKRLGIARQEMAVDHYDYYVVNEEDRLEEGVKKIEEIIDKERKKR